MTRGKSYRLGELTKYGGSIRTVARIIGVPPSTMHGYLRTGEIPRSYPDLEQRLADYESRRVPGHHLSFDVEKLGESGPVLARQLGVSHGALVDYFITGVVPGDARDLPQRIDRYVAAKSTPKPVAVAAPRQPKKDTDMLTKILLPQEVLDHWKLSRDPFTNEVLEIDDICDLGELKKAERKIMNAIGKAGWVAITGPVGSGKTTLLKRVETKLAQQKEIRIVKPMLLEKQHMRAGHIVEAILRDLEIETTWTSRSTEAKSRLVGESLRSVYLLGSKVVLLIDEAHLLHPYTLLGLKRIHELDLKFNKLMSIILIGQQSLARQLRGNFQLTEVGQRVDLFELEGMNGSTGRYLAYKLERAGAQTASEVFLPAAIKAIAERVDTPLSINNLAAAAMAEAYKVGEAKITADIVKAIVPGR